MTDHPNPSDGMAIGCFANLCRDRLADHLLTYSRLMPQSGLGVHELTLAELLPAVRTGRVALAIAPEAPGDEALATMALWDEQAVVAMAADHPLAAERRPGMDALRDALMLLSTDRAEGEMQRFLLARLFPRGLPTIRALPGRGVDLNACVAAGEGVTLLLAGHEVPEGIVTRPIAAPAARFTVHAVWHPDHRSAPLSTLLRLLHGERSTGTAA